MKKENINDSLMLYWNDPRISKDVHSELKKLPMCMIFSFDTSNIYICNFQNSIKRETRAFMKVKRARGEPISFNDAIQILVAKKINHETMHKILYKTIDKHAAVLYDKLLNGFHTGGNAMSEMTFDEDEVLY